jgi:S1-C subfamily serine protease
MTKILLTAFVALLTTWSAHGQEADSDSAPAGPAPATNGAARKAAETAARSVVRVETASQSWNPGQPWERSRTRSRRGLGALIAEGQILTTSEMAADATLIEFESPDGTRTATAKVHAVDYEANLALLTLADPQKDADFFDDMLPLELAADPEIGTHLDIVQVENNGRTLLTRGSLRSVDITSSFLDGHFFLTFEVKASMQSAASSYTLPVLRDGKLAGILTSYNGKDQISDVIATEIVRQFLEQAKQGGAIGFPSLGISATSTTDPSFRKWLKLPDSAGGLYVNKVRVGSSADQAGIREGDVILSIDEAKIDRRGYFESPLYGPLFWSHLIRGSRIDGDVAAIGLWRDGKPTAVKATLKRRDRDSELVPNHMIGQAPPFLVKGGFIFQELSEPLLQAFDKDWESKAPLNLLDAYLNPEDYDKDRDRIVFLSGVIATPATLGYERINNLVVSKVNGKPITDMNALIAAFDEPTDGLHSIEFDDEDFPIYLDEMVSNAVDEQLLQRGIAPLSRTR